MHVFTIYVQVKYVHVVQVSIYIFFLKEVSIYYAYLTYKKNSVNQLEQDHACLSRNTKENNSRASLNCTNIKCIMLSINKKSLLNGTRLLKSIFLHLVHNV